MVGPGSGGGDFAPSMSTVGGRLGGGKTSKPKVQSGLEIKKSTRSGKGKLSRKVPISETGKSYAEQAYKTSIKVKVKFKDGKTIIENVKGMNEGHALARAKSNWPGSAVIKIK